MARLTKFDVEHLLDDYDADPIGALSRALTKVLDATPGTPWADLVAAAPLEPEVKAGLSAGDEAVLDELTRLLNELRWLSGAG